jgi:hypothetical protein
MVTGFAKLALNRTAEGPRRVNEQPSLDGFGVEPPGSI